MIISENIQKSLKLRLSIIVLKFLIYYYNSKNIIKIKMINLIKFSTHTMRICITYFIHTSFKFIVFYIEFIY